MWYCVYYIHTVLFTVTASVHKVRSSLQIGLFRLAEFLVVHTQDKSAFQNILVHLLSIWVIFLSIYII